MKTCLLKSGILLVLLGLLNACSAAARPPTALPAQPVMPADTPSPSPRTGVSPLPSPTACVLQPVVIPTLPAEVPGYAELDPTTGLHVTGTYLLIDLKSYRLEVLGKVNHPLQLTYDELRCLPRIETTCTLVCPGFFEDTTTWAGASLNAVLQLAGIQPEAKELWLYSADGYSTSVSLEAARRGENFLAYEWQNQPLPILHGFPVRAVFPDQQGNKWVKWLVRISAE